MWKPSYATLLQMHDWLRLNDPGDVDDDGVLTLNLSAASRAVDVACGRQFGKADTPVSRVYPLRWSRTLGAHVADIDDLMDLTGLTVSTDDGVTTLDTTEYKLWPRNAIADGMVYTYVTVGGRMPGCSCGFGFPFGFEHDHPELTMVAPWGWDAFPDVVVEGTLLQASRLNIRRDSAYGMAGSPDSGTDSRLLARLDPDVEPIIEGYIRTGWTAR